jgi:hypothetical protein
VYLRRRIPSRPPSPAARRPDEPHPLEVGSDMVQRYFKLFDECAQVARLKLL